MPISILAHGKRDRPLPAHSPARPLNGALGPTSAGCHCWAAVELTLGLDRPVGTGTFNPLAPLPDHRDLPSHRRLLSRRARTRRISDRAPALIHNLPDRCPTRIATFDFRYTRTPVLPHQRVHLSINKPRRRSGAVVLTVRTLCGIS